MEIDREYRPLDVERRWSAAWEKAGLFKADPDSDRPPFCMVIPPPNVTGNLHIGHVLVYTLHDICARWRRMRGDDVLWLPGTDHAGIATQMVVERELAQTGQSRQQLGREAFERRAWEWKEKYGGAITGALHELGSSVDWSRERFTLDEGLSRAVRSVFVRLHQEGLIYRGRYIVNWCPRCHTAISDLETNYQAVEGRLYTIRYPAAAGSDHDIRIATTRPETLLGDTGIAVHPDDERYAEHVGGSVEVPLTGRSVPIVVDSFVDPEFGTGAVKITPAHDPNDFEAGQRLGLPQMVIIDTAGKMTEAAGEYAGLDRFEARKRVVDDLQHAGLLLEVQPHEHAVGHCQRCRTMIEPLVSTQWFVKIKPLAEPAIAAVEQGRVRFTPATWAKTYFEWMRNIHDWCISRQLWWGHRIPAWYCDACDRTIVAETDPTECDGCRGALRQDEDVLDTWFSSALWPFSTLGWPEQTKDLEHYYPTQLLITGHDIIFFWVARMIMMGIKFQGDVPFRDVYIHGLVRDAEGRKMSKSTGNTVDPQEVHSRYGTDAVRLTMAMLAAPGNDIPLAPERMEGYRNFANKLWNACRFVLLKLGDVEPPAVREIDRMSLADRWILSRTAATVREVNAALEEFRFDRAADRLYHFAWRQFCDWYIEFAKLEMAGDDEARSTAARAVLLETLTTLLRLLHPFMPFLTEELWHKLPGERGFLAVADWPEPATPGEDAEADADVELLQELVVKVRNLRAETRIDPARRVELYLETSEAKTRALLESQQRLLSGILRADVIHLEHPPAAAGPTARAVTRSIRASIPLTGLLDLDAERTRLQRDLARVEKELDTRTRKLSNDSFLERAPAEVVERERELQRQLAERRSRLHESLTQLDPLSPD